MHLIGYINNTTEPEFLDLQYGIEYLLPHPHEPIVYSMKSIFKVYESPLKCFLKSIKVEMNQN